MKTQIFYFSSTGNSMMIAKKLSEKLPDSETIFISKVFNESILSDAEKIGFVFPVYAFTMPRIFSDFVKKLDISKAKYIFAIVTFSGNSGASLLKFNSLLKTKGKELNSAYEIKQPSNYIPFGEAIPTEEQNKQFQERDILLKKITEDINQNKDTKMPQKLFHVNWLIAMVCDFFVSTFKSFDKDLWADEKCNNCKTCEKVCPRQNIETKDNKRYWKHDCEGCLACLQWCPKEAIQYKKTSINKKRYRQPDVKLSDFIVNK